MRQISIPKKLDLTLIRVAAFVMLLIVKCAIWNLMPWKMDAELALTDAAGSLSESYRYDVFGAPSIYDGIGNSITTSVLRNRFLFTGREWIAKLELYDYRNPQYLAELRRFLQTDPIRFDARDTNLYRYVSNNPVKYWDPFGKEQTHATIQCDGNGNYEIVLNKLKDDAGEKAGGCITKHEQRHIDDWKKRYGEKSCEGRARGELPNDGERAEHQISYMKFVRESECSAYNTEKRCLLECPESEGIKEGKKHVETQIAKYCDGIPGL